MTKLEKVLLIVAIGLLTMYLIVYVAVNYVALYFAERLK